MKKMWTSTAPSNIALIKYMGKQPDNIPCNISLSYTLDKFYTSVTLESHLKYDVFINESLSEQEKNRFLAHLAYIKHLTNFAGYFSISSHNSFPKSAGIASSASSFAALTMCAFKAISPIQGSPPPSLEYMSSVSRHGSGSSCRSFFAPWCVWNGDTASAIDIPFLLDHDLILIDSHQKEVSSSEAHRRVPTSLLFNGRPQRATHRFEHLLQAFEKNEWDNAYQICWEEFWDMHALFETSVPSFGYILPKTIEILQQIRSFWKKHNDGPIVTIDAGPNIHLLWKKNAMKEIRNLFMEEISLPNLIFL